MARLTKRIVDDVYEMTSGCYKYALLEQYTHLGPECSDRLELSELQMYLVNLDLPVRSPEINEKYLLRVKQLTSEQLSLIIAADDKLGGVRRSPITIHAIMDELFERAANSETR